VNKEQTLEAIKVMQAWADGEKIEALWRHCLTEGWRSDPEPSWNFQVYEYRIKPEPIEFDVVLNKFNEVVYLKNGSKIDRFGVPDVDTKSMRQIKVREVLE
jgi:hypothetical protein